MARFPDDYVAARRAFRAAAARAGAAEVIALPLDTPATDGTPLSIDIAWLGDPAAPSVLLHSCGLHGVEGFAGSAIQLALLERPPPLGRKVALVLVHVLNPYGMDRLRRVNGHNVDLNRNCVADGEERRGAPAAYRLLDPLLNPPTPPSADGFYVRALARAARHGHQPLQAAVAGGQYEYPRGLFFGGRNPEPEIERYREWVTTRLTRACQVWVLDVHTGLGQRGAESLFAETHTASDPSSARVLGRTAITPGAQGAGGYAVRGGLCAALARWLPGAVVHAFTQEFGTRPALRVLHALRQENRWHHYGDGSLDHPAKRRLKAAFCPDHARWRARVLNLGIRRVHHIARALTTPEGGR